MNSQMKGLLISLGTMQVARKVPTDRPDILMAIRISYVVILLLQFALYNVAALRIKKRNDTTVLKYCEPPKPFAGANAEPPPEVVTTNRDYDLQQVSKNYPGLLIGAAIMGFMHLKLGYTQPLLLQSIMPLKSLYDNPILKIWIFGKPATGDLARPFKAPAGLMSALQEGTDSSSTTPAVAAAGSSSAEPKIQEIVEDEPKKSK